MNELLNALSDPSSMNQAQWLVLAIAGFIIVGSMYFVWRLLRIVKGIGKTTYKPNIGLSRTGFHNAAKQSEQSSAPNSDSTIDESMEKSMDQPIEEPNKESKPE